MLVGCLLLGVGLKERSGLVHSVGRYAPVRLRAWTLRDSGRFPLTPQKNAKDGELRTQLAALRQVSAALQRILLRAKRKPAPGIRRSMPGASPALRWAGGGNVCSFQMVSQRRRSKSGALSVMGWQ